MEKEARIAEGIKINRAPVLTLSAALVHSFLSSSSKGSICSLLIANVARASVYAIPAKCSWSE